MRKVRALQVLVGSVAVAAALAGSAIPALAQQPDPEAPEGTYLIRSEHAVGWQIYSCNDNNVYQFSRPYATLTNDVVHYGPGNPGAWWETYNQPFSRVRAVAVGTFPNDDPGSNIPDLLLNAAETEGDGPLANVSNVIRRNAVGGGPDRPGQPCDPADGDLWVDYEADYEFYGQ